MLLELLDLEKLRHHFNVLHAQWKPFVFLVIPLALMVHNFIPDPLEIYGTFMQRYYGRHAPGEKPVTNWSWKTFEAAVERDRRVAARYEAAKSGGQLDPQDPSMQPSKRPMTPSKARVLYWMFGSEKATGK